MPRTNAESDALNEALATITRHFVRAIVNGETLDAVAGRVADKLEARKHGGPAAQRAAVAADHGRWLTQRQASAYSGRSVSTLRRARRTGLSSAVVGGLVVFDRHVLDAWLSGEAAVPPDATHKPKAPT